MGFAVYGRGLCCGSQCRHGKIAPLAQRYAPSARDIAFGCDMCARGLLRLIRATNSSAVINFANEESAHAKYFDLV